MPIKNLLNQKFERLTVIKYMGNDNNRKALWLCECDCENKTNIIVRGSDLLKGHTKSCGCLQKEIVKKIGENNKKYNTYDLSGEFGIGYTLKNEPFYFDIEDYDLIKDYCWSLDDNGYLITRDDDKFIRFHKLVMKYDGENDIDHIFGKETRNDNRKYNLRICTRQQNCMNRDAKGIYYDKNSKKWKASICINYKHIYLGFFSDINDALEARNNAENELQGEFRFKGKSRINE
jgi:hypothetical protein